MYSQYSSNSTTTVDFNHGGYDQLEVEKIKPTGKVREEQEEREGRRRRQEYGFFSLAGPHFFEVGNLDDSPDDRFLADLV